jgi:hypothetical protein
MADALFEPDGDRFVPTVLARGPWSPDALHGGPPAALLARCVERVEAGRDMLVARLTVELLRPVPVAPLAVESRMLRPGRKVQLVGASLHAGDVEVARVTALRIRTIALPVPPGLAATSPPPGPATSEPSPPPWNLDYEAFHNCATEHRFVAGGFDRPGPARDWVRLRVPLVAGEDTSALARVAAAADFGNGVSWTLPRGEGWQFVNPDLTVALHRLPDGEWVCLEAVTFVESSGVGQAESVLWDEHGRIGRAVQSLLLDRP